MKRLVALLAVLVLLAGCTSGGTATSQPGQTEATTDTAERATTAATCTESTQSTVNPIRDAVTPSAFPDRPDELTHDSVTQFVENYERAHKRNAILEPDTSSVGVSVTVQNVRTVEGGYLVTVDGVYYYNVADVVTRGTATEIHADGPPYTALYYVSEDRIQRTESRRYDATPADPRNGGSILECW